jgi:hypothetical protein
MMNKQWIVLFLLSFTLSACIGNNDSNKDNRVALPDINPNLSTESPEGIWMLHMDIEANETYANGSYTRTNQDNYFIRQIIKIVKGNNPSEFHFAAACNASYLPTNNHFSKDFGTLSSEITSTFRELQSAYNLESPNFTYSIFNLTNTELPTEWNLTDSKLLPILITPDSDSISNFEYMLRPFNFEHPYLLIMNNSGTKKGELSLIDNRELSGSLRFETFSNEPAIMNYQRDMLITGVKLSDSQKFTSADEINFEMFFNRNEIDISDTSNNLGCLRTAEWQSKVITRENDTSEQVIFSKNLATLQFLPPENFSREDTRSPYLKIMHNNNTHKSLLSLTNPELLGIGNTAYDYTNLCLETESSNCQSAINFDMQLDIKSKNGISAKAYIINHDAEEVRAEFSFTIQP